MPLPLISEVEISILVLHYFGKNAKMDLVNCPICDKRITLNQVNIHLDKGCDFVVAPSSQPLKQQTFEPSSSQTSFTEKTSKNPLFTPKKPAEIRVLKRPNEQVSPLAKKKKTTARDKNKPLAELIRPKTLEEYIGQKDLVGPNGILKGFIQRDTCPSIILWGPSGVCMTGILGEI